MLCLPRSDLTSDSDLICDFYILGYDLISTFYSSSVDGGVVAIGDGVTVGNSGGSAAVGDNVGDGVTVGSSSRSGAIVTIVGGGFSTGSRGGSGAIFATVGDVLKMVFLSAVLVVM